MMNSTAQHYSISVEKQGPTSIAKGSFPLRYGKYSEIRTADYEFRFNLNGEIKFIRGLNTQWPHPAEQLKRTEGNDWIYYTVGDNKNGARLIEWLGEYYLPCLPYPSNSVWEVNYFSNPNIMNAFGAWYQLYANLFSSKDRLRSKAKNLAESILKSDDSVLHRRAEELNTIIGQRVSVLPPDTRHIDYEVIPLTIADGCLYHCKFCCVQSSHTFQKRPQTNITEQIRRLKLFYGRNIENYNALFLGNHDALAAGEEWIRQSATRAAEAFGFGKNSFGKPCLFLFGSVDSFLKAPDSLFGSLEQSPYYTYINIGFESVDPSTLKYIHKPVEDTKVREAFRKMIDINGAYEAIEITGNFLIGENLPPDHYPSLTEILQNTPAPPEGKGAIYLSPLMNSPKKRELLPTFFDIKNQTRMPLYIYLIQRL